MNKKFISIFVLLYMFIMPLQTIRAEAIKGIYDNAVKQVKYLNGGTFYLSGEEKDVLPPRTKGTVSAAITALQYNHIENMLQIDYEVFNGTKKHSGTSYGNTYHNISVNADISLIADMQGPSSTSIVYLELFQIGDESFIKIIVEENATGNVFILEDAFDNELFQLIDSSAFHALSNEEYFDLVTDLGNSPNYAGLNSKGAQTFEAGSSVTFTAGGTQFQEQLLSASTIGSRAEWKQLFDDFNKSYAFGVSSYDVDQTFFTDLTTVPGAQYKASNAADGEMDFSVARIAYYQAATGTYSFFLTLLNTELIVTGRNIYFEFGMTTKENESSSTLLTFRAELNKNNRTLRYVADKGMKITPQIAISEIDRYTASNKFTKVIKAATVQANDRDCLPLIKMALGIIPKYNFGTIYTIIDTLYGLYTNPEVSENTWEGSSTNNTATLKSSGYDADLYHSGDFYCINAYTSSSVDWYKVQYNYTYYAP